MSVSAMTNVAYARRADVPPVDTTPADASEIEQAAGGTQETPTGTTSAISAITTYIPTEIMTLYVAVLGALHKDEPPPKPDGDKLELSVLQTDDSQQKTKVDDIHPKSKVDKTEWFAFSFFLVATPEFVWLLYAAKVRNSNRQIPPGHPRIKPLMGAEGTARRGNTSIGQPHQKRQCEANEVCPRPATGLGWPPTASSTSRLKVREKRRKLAR